ncbi:amidohydrolase family protein [Pelagibacterium sp.]|uniref:amidohydrolase family protein n=1 Tax=Pelagibacterium sp. TaxID=1967288 RepID=UPI003C7ADA55
MTAPVPSTTGAIDCDVHIAVPNTGVLLPYLDEHWREHVSVRGIDDLELTYERTKSPIACRPDWRPAKGKPGSSLDALRSTVLDGFAVKTAICNVMWGGMGLHAADLSAALCRAVNDWVAENWLDKDTRLRASISIPLEHPHEAAAEIERCAADKRFVQVLLLAMGDAPLGKQQYWPIYEAAERHGIAIGIHAGTTYRQAPTSMGWPSYYIEDYVSQASGMQGQLLSLVYEGVFAKFPNLRVVLSESGISWLPSFLWRADKTWRGLRMEVPWVKQTPSQIIRDHVRLTLRPLDAPDDAETLKKVVEQLGNDDMLLFATDYPHWHFDGDLAIPEGFDPELLNKMMFVNPLDAYPRLKEKSQ